MITILVTAPQGNTRDTFIPAEVKEKLEQMGNVIWNTSLEQFTPSQLKQALRDVDVCLTGWGCQRFTEDVLEYADKLKVIAHTGGSVASLVSDYLYDQGVTVLSGNDLYAESVAEGVVGYALSALRDIPFYVNEMKKGYWRGEQFFNEGLLDQAVGLIGFGMVAKHLVKLLQPFRVNVKVYAKPEDEVAMAEYGVKRASLEEIFSTCKVISVHVPQIPETYHMIDERLLSMIPAGSILINTARGSIIDEQALVKKLRQGTMKAVLDVFEEEPLPEGSDLRQLDNALLIPHMAGPTIDRRKMVTLGLLEDVDRLFRGDPLRYEINREYSSRMTR